MTDVLIAIGMQTKVTSRSEKARFTRNQLVTLKSNGQLSLAYLNNRWK